MWPLADITFKTAQKSCFIDHKIMGTFYYTGMGGIIASILFIWVLFIDNNWNELWKTDIYNLNGMELGLVLINGFCLISVDTVSNITNSITSPLFVNVGNLLSIPMGFVVDIFVHDYQLSLMPIIGSIFIMIGFLMMEIWKPPQKIDCLAFCGKTIYQRKSGQIYELEVVNNEYHQYHDF